jgi:hypothetical protein
MLPESYIVHILQLSILRKHHNNTSSQQYQRLPGPVADRSHKIHHLEKKENICFSISEEN